jgi:drug/metabolite transporter (DMT)-like permease
LAGAFAASVAYGVATILQTVGARRDDVADELDTRLVSRLLGSAPYVAGLLLDALGFALSFAALRSLPLFTVQAIVASSLAVTALLAVLLLGAHLTRPEWLALLCVTTGLTLLALSASKQRPIHIDTLDRSLLVISVATVGTVAFVSARRRHGVTRSDGWAFGVLAGLMYGAGGIAARMLRTPHHVWQVVEDPALWALASAGILGLLLYAMALQRGTVTVATAAVVVAETLVPAAVGITLLGDRPAHGGTPVAAVGFGLAVAGAVALARHGEASTHGDDTVNDLATACLS